MTLTPEQELWGVALAMVKQHGEDAEIRAAALADEMLDKGDFDGRRVWLHILSNIEVMRQAAATKH